MKIINTKLPNKAILYWICLLAIVFVSACDSHQVIDLQVPTGTRPIDITPIPSETVIKQIPSVLTPTSTSTEASTQTPTQTISNSPSPKPTQTTIPTYSILRGEVLVRSNCRYGPGAPYLYKYGLLPGSNLEIIGRNDAGSWLLVRGVMPAHCGWECG